VLDKNDEDYALVQNMIFGGTPMQPSLDSALGMLCGNMVGDAIGAPLEFKSVHYGVREVHDMAGDAWSDMRFFLKPGQWTDDASMALCIADSLLISGREHGIDGCDLRLRFLHWWNLGYNNAFANDPSRRGGSSVGLGGNISMSFGDFLRNKTPKTNAGDEFTSGNGSVMRNSPVACCYWNDTERAMAESEKQSLTTHRGLEAAQCSRMLSFVCTRAAQMRSENPTAQRVLSCLESFQSPIYSVQCLAAARIEDRCAENAKFELVDRAWDWKNPEYRYSPLRSSQQPGYVVYWLIIGK
jgi:ADP-ribosyl-[dinitrogen reductase] hydrolase